MCCDTNFICDLCIKPLDKYQDIFELKSTKFICVIWNHMKIHCIGLRVVDMFDQARLKLRRARVSITSTEGMVVGAAGLIISICRILKGNQLHSSPFSWWICCLPGPLTVMVVWWNLEQEGHDLVDVDNLDWLAGVAGLEVGAPGEADSLHLVRELVVEGNLLGLPGAHLLLFVLGPAGDDVGGRRLRVVTTLSQVIAGGRKGR